MKSVYDAIHGFIGLNPFENSWLKTPWFLRLQMIHQLGVAYKVFPCARHTRYEHSLGVMHLATKIFDHLLDAFKKEFLFLEDPEICSFYRQILRLSCLSHDLGHLPFSHTAEEHVLKDECHEAWTLRVLDSEEVVNFLSPIITEGEKFDINAHKLLKKIAVGEAKFVKYCSNDEFSPFEKILTEILTGDFFGSDRMDYLLRDAKYTGLTYGFFDHEQIIQTLLIDKDPNSGSATLMIDYKGVQACESLLLARYFMYQRVYMNPKVLRFVYPMKYIIEKIMIDTDALTSVENFLKISDVEVLSFIRNKGMDRDFFIGEEKSYDVIEISQLQKEMLKNQTWVTDLYFWEKKKKSTFLDTNFPVKTSLGQIMSFSQCSKLQIPQINENFVLFEKHLTSNVLASMQNGGYL